MKRIALLTVAMVLAATMSYAHCGNCPMDKEKKGKNPEECVKTKMEKITERLSLTEEQASQVEPLVKEKVEKKKAAKEEYKAKKEAIKKEYSAKIKALLTDEQKVKMDEWKAEMKAEKQAKHGHGDGDCPPDCKCKLCLLKKDK